MKKNNLIIYISTHKSNDYKLTTVQYYIIENIQMCWVERYKNKGNVNIKLLVDEINKNKTITLYELNQKLKYKFLE